MTGRDDTVVSAMLSLVLLLGYVQVVPSTTVHLQFVRQYVLRFPQFLFNVFYFLF